MRPLGDVKWTLAPLVSFLHSLGGWGFRMVIRGIGIPLAVVGYAFLYNRTEKKWYWFIYAALLVGMFAAFTLPLTLIGDGLNDHWFNWLWIWIAGALKGSSLLPLAFLGKDTKKKLIRYAIGVGLCSLAWGLTLTLSNTIGFPVHKWVEIICGVTLGGVAAWLV